MLPFRLACCVSGLALLIVPGQSSPTDAGHDDPISIRDDEAAAHLIGPWPELQVGAAQATRDWPYFFSFDFDVTVSDRGEVIGADCHPLATSEPHYQSAREAEKIVRGLRFVPVVRSGHPVFARFLMSIPVFPPDELPSVHVPFPSIGNRGSLTMSLTRTRCYGRCADYRIQIHGDGRVDYEGHCDVAVTGRHTGRISSQNVDALREEFQEADFFSLKDNFMALSIDAPRAKLSISIDGHEKTLTDQDGRQVGMPKAIEKLELEMDRVSNSKRWVLGNASNYLDVARKHHCR